MDEDDKARRNLVVFSALVLAGAWLRLQPLATLGSILRPDASIAIDSHRAWALVLAVLLYLLYRYRFSEDSIESSKLLDEVKATYQLSLMKALANWDLRTTMKRGRKPWFSPEDFRSEVQARASQLLMEREPNGPPEARFDGIKSKSEWSLTLNVTVVQPLKQGGSGAYSFVECVFAFQSKGIRQVIKVCTFVASWLYSPWTARGLPPLALSFATLTVTLWHLFRP
jgi:hypothetical protein